jgi:hypothetical protein
VSDPEGVRTRKTDCQIRKMFGSVKIECRIRKRKWCGTMQRGPQTKAAEKWHELERLSEGMVLHWKRRGSKVQLQTDPDPRQESVRIRTRRSGLRYLPNLTWAQWIVAGLIYFVSLDFINIVILYTLLICVHVLFVWMKEIMYVSDTFGNELRLCLFDLKFDYAGNEPKSLKKQLIWVGKKHVNVEWKNV